MAAMIPNVWEVGNWFIKSIAIPVVNSDSCYLVLNNQDIIYAEGLSHDVNSASPFSIPLKLDVYTPSYKNP